MGFYILKFSCSLAIFLGFYKLALERESFHVFKRFYLIGSLVISFIIPLIFLVNYVEPIVVANSLSVSGFTPELTARVQGGQDRSIDSPLIILVIYSLGLLFFGLKFVQNLVDLIGRIQQNPKIKEGGLYKVLVDSAITPHTFLNHTFYNSSAYVEAEIPQEVIWHEEVHARQLHSLDVLFVEVLQLIMWFNPLIYMVKKLIKLNHEFLADRGVLNRGVLASHYQKIVLLYAVNGGSHSVFSNAFYFSFIKKRFTIMKTKTTQRAMFVRFLLLIPIIAMTFLSLSGRTVKVLPPDEVIVHQSSQLDAIPVQDESISAIEEYNRLAKHYNQYPSYDFVTKVKDMWRIRHLYEELSEQERVEAEPYPKSTTTLTIIITNKGDYKTQEGEKLTIESIENMLKQLSQEERSNAFVFSDELSVGKYIRDRGALNRGSVPPNDVYINLYSEEFVAGKYVNTNESPKFIEKNGMKLATPALVNPALNEFVEEWHSMFRKYGVHVDYN